MSDRKALDAALEREPLWIDVSDPEYRTPLRDWVEPIIVAARERRDQLPEKCEPCGGTGILPPFVVGGETDVPCNRCHGSGQVYPAELVERIAAELHHGEQDLVEFLNLAQARLVTVAVLDALNGETR